MSISKVLVAIYYEKCRHSASLGAKFIKTVLLAIPCLTVPSSLCKAKDKPPAGWYWAWLGKGGDVIARKGSKADYAFLSCEAARESAENVFLNTIWAAYATTA